MLAPKVKTIEENQEEGTDANKTKLSEEKLEKLFSKLDSSGLDNWDQDLQIEAQELIVEFELRCALPHWFLAFDNSFSVITCNAVFITLVPNNIGTLSL